MLQGPMAGEKAASTSVDDLWCTGIDLQVRIRALALLHSFGSMRSSKYPSRSDIIPPLGT